MKTYRDLNLRKMATSCFAAFALTWLPASLAGPPTKEKFVVATNISMAFPARPDGVTGTLIVSSPIIVIDDSLSCKMGGQAFAKMVRPPLENMLNNSGRFTVQLEGEAPYKIKATVTSLTITQVHDEKGAAASKFIGGVLSQLGKKNKIDPELFTADWSRGETIMRVECGLTVQIMNKASTLIAGNTGTVTREDKTAVIKAVLGGATFGTGGSDGLEVPTVNVDFPTRLIELAAYDSLSKSIAAIDKEIVERKFAVSTVTKADDSALAETKGSVASEQAAVVNKVKFCGQCGQKIDGDDKFCSSCGKQVRK